MQRRCIRQDFRTSRVLPFGIPTRTHWRSMHSQPHSRSSKESAAESVRRSLAKGAGAQTDDPTEAHLRDFRDRATQARLFPTALFWAQKVWAMSRVFCWLETVIECDHVSPQRAERLEDVYELAHIYFLTRDFSRAERLLKDYVRSCSKCLLLSAQCAVRDSFS